ncbi:other/FunK1 protein kinase [Coprinopsis cinerea okayama7|uniref:Other/FunK1 protein kinase n=1 Tax=Coprinopsis cinerea (strain Okayama-7 / 130 / ATCC MYA-4618 / FGSC 9003) TaxID=240176 RepID=A8NB59_COPC7|nr:other/FunK1 protein kinase [Coprinopsis cinerea okayama7\|eukprot:XP_001832060.2 other/FunK1 protein kinase [Coprinopsis cinerea okayama7\
MRMDIGDLMNSEMYVCTYNQFKEYYLPKCDDETMSFVNDALKASEFLVPREERTGLDDGAAVGNEDEDAPSDDAGSVRESNDELPQERGELNGEVGEVDEGNEGEGEECEEIEEQGYVSDDEGEDDQGAEGEGDSNSQVYSHVLCNFQMKPSLLRKKAKNNTTSSSDKPKTSNTHENKVFSPLGEIGTEILKALDEKGIKRNGSHLRMCPHTTIYSNIPGCNQEIDACLTKNKSKALDIADILVPFEFKLAYTIAKVFLNRRQVVSQANHTMNDDPRRRFMFAITIEDDRVSLWFFSRSHSVKAKSFSMIDRPDLLVEVLVSLFCATEEQLGLDPLVHLTEDRRYVYEFPPNKTRPKPIFYRTTGTVIEARTQRLICRATRIWRVIQVESPDHTEAIEGSKEMILKDVSLPEEFRTEFEIQRDLFRDLEDLAKDKEWRQREILKDFVAEDLVSLERALQGGFKRYFSCIIDEHVGEVTPPLCPGAWAATTPMFTEPRTIAPDHNRNRAAPGTRAPRRPTAGPPGELGTIQEELQHRGFNPRRPCRLIFDEPCIPLSDVPTLGELVDIVQQCLIPLRLMFCVGWVHRDISPGNILVFRTSPTAQWQVKLSDLEYAKRFPCDDQPSPIPKTGTPAFMACEILTKSLISKTGTGKGVSRRKGPNKLPVIHNYQHDLESLWWIILWAITMRVKQSLQRANLLFREANAHARRGVFTDEDSIEDHEQVYPCFPVLLCLSGFVEQLDLLRIYFESEYISRNRGNKQQDIGTYSLIVSEGFWNFFEGIKGSRKVWGDLPLLTDTELAPGTTAPRGTKRKYSDMNRAPQRSKDAPNPQSLKQDDRTLKSAHSTATPKGGHGEKVTNQEIEEGQEQPASKKARA